MNRLLMITLRCLCGAFLLAGTMQAFAEEKKEETKKEEQGTDTEKKRIPVGSRMLSKAEHAAIQEKRASEAQESGLDAGDQGQRETVKAILDSKESRLSAAVNGVTLPAIQAGSFVSTHPAAFHRPLSVSLSGDSIELEDGSIWAVAGGDAYKTLNWLTSDLLVITPNPKWFLIYDYCITNVNTGVTVNVSLVLGPLYDALYRHWIVSIDFYKNIIWLEDGTLWEMASGDSSAMKNWLAGDTVIIGHNEGWFSSYNPNILINVNVANYARGKCIR